MRDAKQKCCTQNVWLMKSIKLVLPRASRISRVQFDRVWYYYIVNGDIGNQTYPDYITGAPISEIMTFVKVGE